MGCYLDGMQGFWDGRFEHEGRVWGERPSRTAEYAMKQFGGQSINKILIPGAGYGRNSKFFSDNGYNVTGIEISERALSLAREYDLKTKFNSSVLQANIGRQSYDAIYCFNFLHLFRQQERKLLVSQCHDWLKLSGYVFFTVFSLEEPTFGKGSEVEENTFESKPGRPVHYFSDSDLREHFSNFEILETGIMEDPENHGDEGEHIHRVAYIYAKK